MKKIALFHFERFGINKYYLRAIYYKGDCLVFPSVINLIGLSLEAFCVKYHAN